ncbi:MAG: hypothetical protein OXI73_05565 [Rhodospirillales bacterium]|nr:hypothetical protein [Rhodospirillales bacterium]
MTSSLIAVAAAGALLLLASCSDASLGDPIVRDGATYTPSVVDDHGCVLYAVSRADGPVPAAMVYLGMDGEFSYVRPERCVERNSTADVND